MNWFASLFFDWVWNRILGLLKMLAAKQKVEQDLGKDAANDSKKAKAVTPESSPKEVDDAIDDELRHF